MVTGYFCPKCGHPYSTGGYCPGCQVRLRQEEDVRERNLQLIFCKCGNVYSILEGSSRVRCPDCRRPYGR